MISTNLPIQTVAPIVLTTDSTARSYKSVETILTDRDALRVIANIPSQFAGNLIDTAKRGRLSHNQKVWIHALAMDTLPRRVSAPASPASSASSASSASPVRPDFTPIVELFDTARAKARAKNQQGANLKIRLSVAGQGIAIKPAGSNSRNAGFLYVTDGGDYDNATYLGKIAQDGTFFPSRDCTAEITALLTNFAANPAKFAAEFGRLTNQCCFCGRLLTDDKEGRSVEVGYGPVCADKYGLDWG